MPNLYNEHMKLSHRLTGIVNSIGSEIAEVLGESLGRISGLTLLAEERATTTKSLVRRKTYLLKQQKEIQKVLDSVYADIGGKIKGKAVEVAQASPAIANDILKTVIPKSFKISMGVPNLTKKRVLLWFESSQVDGLFYNDWLKKLSENTTARIIRETRLAMLAHEGQGPRKIAAKRIQEALGVSRKSATGLAENAIRQAQSWAQRQFDIENRERLKGLRWVSELDRQTCPKCVSG